MEITRFNLTKESTRMIKGMAVSLIVLSHIFTSNRFISSMGLSNVVLLLILSGYGLTKKYKLHSREPFYKQRFIKIYIPYFMVALIDVLILKTLPIKTKILTLLCLDFKFTTDVSMWYIAVLLIWYVFFGVLLKLNINKRSKLCLLFILGLALRFQNIGIGSSYAAFFSHMSSSAFAFPIGVLLADVDEHVARYMQNFELNKLFCSFLACVYLYFLYGKGQLYPYLYAAFIIILFYILQDYCFRNELLHFLGGISYAIYLWELKLIYFFILRKHGYLGYFIILIAVSSLTHFAFQSFIKAASIIQYKFKKVCSKRI